MSAGKPPVERDVAPRDVPKSGSMVPTNTDGPGTVGAVFFRGLPINTTESR